MKRILVIINNPKQAAYRLRVAALAEKLHQRGFHLDIQVRSKSFFARRRLLRSAGQYDAVLLQRKFLDPADARLLRRYARRIVYDVDDAVMYSPKNDSWLNRWRLKRRYRATGNILDHVVAGNEYLAEQFRAFSCRTTVLPTMVDPAHYGIKQHGLTDGPRLVWIGSRSTLPYLRTCLPAIEAAARQVTGLRLQVIADETIGGTSLPVDFVTWSQEQENAALLRGDIGIAPTPTDRWTLGKCGFKIVQYMAAGLPVIASPVGANCQLVREQITGFLADTPEQWISAIVKLTGDPDLRTRMGRSARQIVESEYCLDRAVDVWANLLDQ